MKKYEVIESFSLLGRFDEIKNLVRKNTDKKGYLYKEDTFECEKDLAKYLLGENSEKRPFIKLIEVIPDKAEVKEIKKRTTKKRKSIAND